MEGMLMLLVMMVITIVLAWALSGEQRKRAVSLFLCVAMMSSYIPAINVARADSSAKPVLVNEQVIVNGVKAAQIGAVTYSETGSAYTLDTSSARVRVKNGDSISFEGAISAPEGETISWVRVDVYDANTEEPYTVGAEYYRASGMKVQEFDLASIPALTIGEAFGSKDYALVEGGKYIVMFCVGDSNGNTFVDMDADIEDDQGPAILVDVKLSPSNCMHPHSDYRYVRHSSGEIRTHSYGDSLTHQVEPLYDRYCGLCDTFLMSIWGQGTPEEHTFDDNGVCLACGYTEPVVPAIMMYGNAARYTVPTSVNISEVTWNADRGMTIKWDYINTTNSSTGNIYYHVAVREDGTNNYPYNNDGDLKKQGSTATISVTIPADEFKPDTEYKIWIKGYIKNGDVSALEEDISNIVADGCTEYFTTPEEDYLEITDPSNLEMEFGAGKESQVLYLSASGRWTAECDEDWVTLSRTSGGTSDTSITVTVKANNGDAGVEREACIYIALSSGSLEEEVYIYQEGREMTKYEEFQAAVDDLEIDFARGDYEDAVTTDVGLPETGLYGVTISWESSNTSIVDDNGTVTRPNKDTEVELVATLTYYQYSEEKVFYVTVLADESVVAALPELKTSNAELDKDIYAPGETITITGIEVKNAVNVHFSGTLTALGTKDVAVTASDSWTELGAVELTIPDWDMSEYYGDYKVSVYAENEDGVQTDIYYLEFTLGEEVCPHTNVTWKEETVYKPLPENTAEYHTHHAVVVTKHAYCNDCDVTEPLDDLYPPQEVSRNNDLHQLTDGDCLLCGYEATFVPECEHKNKVIDESTIIVEKQTETEHTISYWYFCNDCQTLLNNVAREENTAAHTFNENDVCTVCGYTKNPQNLPTMTFTVNKPVVNAGEEVEFKFTMTGGSPMANKVMFYADDQYILTVGDNEMFAPAPGEFTWKYKFNQAGLRKIHFVPLYEDATTRIEGVPTAAQEIRVNAYLNLLMSGVPQDTTTRKIALTVYDNGGSGTPITVDSNVAWSVKTDVSWIKLTADTANKQILHEYEVNNTGAARVGTITVSAPGCQDWVITCTQETVPLTWSMWTENSYVKIQASGSTMNPNHEYIAHVYREGSDKCLKEVKLDKTLSELHYYNDLSVVRGNTYRVQIEEKDANGTTLRTSGIGTFKLSLYATLNNIMSGNVDVTNTKEITAGDSISFKWDGSLGLDAYVYAVINGTRITLHNGKAGTSAVTETISASQYEHLLTSDRTKIDIYVEVESLKKSWSGYIVKKLAVQDTYTVYYGIHEKDENGNTIYKSSNVVEAVGNRIEQQLKPNVKPYLTVGVQCTIDGETKFIQPDGKNGYRFRTNSSILSFNNAQTAITKAGTASVDFVDPNGKVLTSFTVTVKNAVIDNEEHSIIGELLAILLGASESQGATFDDTKYSMYYRYNSDDINVYQKAPATLTFTSDEAENKTLTLWGVSAKDWVQPNEDWRYETHINDPQKILKGFGKHSITGTFTGKTGTATVAIYDTDAKKYICSVIIEVVVNPSIADNCVVKYRIAETSTEKDFITAENNQINIVLTPGAKQTLMVGVSTQINGKTEWLQGGKDGYKYVSHNEDVLKFSKESAEIIKTGTVNVDFVDKKNNVLSTFTVSISENYSVYAYYTDDNGEVVYLGPADNFKITSSINPLILRLNVRDENGADLDAAYGSGEQKAGGLYWVSNTNDWLASIKFVNKNDGAYIIGKKEQHWVTSNYAELHGTTNAQYSLTLMRDQGVFEKDIPVATIGIEVDRNTAYKNRYQLVSKDLIMDDEYTESSDIDAYAFDEKGSVTFKFAALDTITKEECYIGTHTYGEKKGRQEFRLLVDGDPVLDDRVTLSTGKYTLSLVHYSGVIVDTLNIEVLTAPPQLSALDFGTVYTANDIPTMLNLINRTINLGYGVLERYEISGDNVFIKTGSGLAVGIRSAVDNGPAGVSDAVYDFLYDQEVFDTENMLTEYLGAHNEEMELVETLLVQEIIATEFEVQLVANGYYTALSNIEQMKYDLSPDLMAEMEKELLPDFVEGVKEMLEEAKGLSEELYEEPLFVKSLEDLTQIESTDDLAYLLGALGYGDSPLYDELISLKYPGSFPKVLDRCYKKNPAKYEKLKNRWDSVNEWKDVLEESGTWLGVIGEISNGIMGYAEIEEKTRKMASMAAHNKVKQKLEVLWNSTEHEDVRNAIKDMLANLSYYVDQRKEDIAILSFKTGGAIGVTILTRLDDLGIIKSKVIHNAVSAIESLDGYKLAKKTVGTKAAKVGATALFVWDTVTSISNTFLVDGQTTSRLYNTVQKEIELLEEKKKQLNKYIGEKMSNPAKLQNLMYTTRMLINATTEHEISYYQLVYDVYVNEDWWRQGSAQIGEIVYGEEGIQETLDACMTCISDCQSIRKELLELSK